MQGKAEDAGGLTPAKDDNAAMRPLYPRAFARNSDDCYIWFPDDNKEFTKSVGVAPAAWRRRTDVMNWIKKPFGPGGLKGYPQSRD